MTAPVWTTTSGKLGTFQEDSSYSIQLEATSSETVTYSIIAGSLPSGLELTSTGVLQGVPAEVPKRTRYTFVVRATAGTTITDRTFYLDIEGADAPTFTTPAGEIQYDDSTRSGLYWILDGQPIKFQIQAADSDTRAGQQLVFDITKGQLPPGVTMNDTGYISGTVQLTQADKGTRGGYDNEEEKYDDVVYDLTVNTISISKNFDFEVRVSDGTSSIKQNNSIFVYSADYWRVSISEITVDRDQIHGTRLSVDFSAQRRPVFTTGSDLGTFRHDNQVAIKIDVDDFDSLQGDLEYTLQSGSLPTGLSINVNSGEITGKLERQAAVENSFSFVIRANRTVATGINVFAEQEFTMKVIGEIDIGISFTTDATVGTLTADQPSTLSIQAIADEPNRVLSYTVTSGSLPTGISLSEQGNLIGTIDPDDFTDSTRSYTFTVSVSDQYQSAATSKEFTLNIDIPFTTLRYGSMNGNATSFIDQNIFYNIAQDPSINNETNIYRGEDPNFGMNLKPEILLLAGLDAQTLTTFQTQMEQNHAPKKLYFGDLKTAVAKEGGVTKYEVVYLEIKDKLENDNKEAVSSVIDIRKDIAKPILGPRGSTVNITADQDVYEVTTNGGLSFNISGSKIGVANPLSADLDVVTKLYPNAVANMRSRMKSLGHKEYSYLPLWMRTVQSGEKAPLGFTLAVPICYCNPGLSALVKKRIADKNLKFKNIDFTIDRYVVTRSKVTPVQFIGDGSTTTFPLDEIVHEEDILVREGNQIISVGEGFTASGFEGVVNPTADTTIRSSDHEFGIILNHDIANKKTSIVFTKSPPSIGTIIKVNRRNDKYLKFNNKGLING